MRIIIDALPGYSWHDPHTSIIDDDPIFPQELLVSANLVLTQTKTNIEQLTEPRWLTKTLQNILNGGQQNLQAHEDTRGKIYDRPVATSVAAQCRPFRPVVELALVHARDKRFIEAHNTIAALAKAQFGLQTDGRIYDSTIDEALDGHGHGPVYPEEVRSPTIIFSPPPCKTRPQLMAELGIQEMTPTEIQAVAHQLSPRSSFQS